MEPLDGDCPSYPFRGRGQAGAPARAGAWGGRTLEGRVTPWR